MPSPGMSAILWRMGEPPGEHRMPQRFFPTPGRFGVVIVTTMRPLIAALLVLLLAWPVLAQAPKAGGTLNLRLREDLPQGFAVHESPTISTLWPAQPCFNNLVQFDPAKPVHGPESI